MKKLLTSLIMLTLIVSSFSVVAFADASTVEVSSWDALTSALAAAPTDGTEYIIKITKGFDDGVSNLEYKTAVTLAAPSGSKVVIDLNNNTLQVIRKVILTGTITIKDGNYTFLNTNSGYYAITVGVKSGTGANVTLDGVTITAQGNATDSRGVTVENSTDVNSLTIDNSNITSSGIAIYSSDSANTLTINSGNFTTTNSTGNVVKFQNGKIKVYGGTFKNITTVPSSYSVYNGGQPGKTTVLYYGGTLPVDISTGTINSLPSGYYCLKTGANEYTVEKSVGAAKIAGFVSTTSTLYDGTHFKTLALAVSEASESQEITLLANNTEAVEISKLATITKNGFTANVTAGEGYVINETDTAYVVEVAPEEPEEPEATTVSAIMGNAYADGNGTKTARFFADIDTLEAAEAGFEVSITVEGIERVWKIALSEVYGEVIANGVTYNATNYILTGAIGEIPSDFAGTFAVKTFVTDFEGDTEYSDPVSVVVE